MYFAWPYDKTTTPECSEDDSCAECGEDRPSTQTVWGISSLKTCSFEMEMQRHTHLPSSSMMLTVIELPNKAGGATLPVRVKSSVPSTRVSSRMSTKTPMVLPSEVPVPNVTSVRDRLKS